MELAMDQLHKADPELSEKIAQSFSLLDASDDATITRYETALTKYLDEGDQSELLAMRRILPATTPPWTSGMALSLSRSLMRG